MKDELIEEKKLGALAKQLREGVGRTRAQAAREFKVAQPTIFQAEEEPDQALVKLRKRMIEEYSDFEVAGPFYVLKKKR